MLQKVRNLIQTMSLTCLGVNFRIIAEEDKIYGGRVYLQLAYTAPCTKTKVVNEWTSGKHYLSEHMTDDEIVKKAYVAFEQCVRHEIMEGFKIDGIILFNPHVDYKELMAISDKEVKRT